VRVHGGATAIALLPLPAYARVNNKRRAEAPMSFLTTRPVWVLILLLVLFTALAMAGPVLVRRYVPLEKLRVNNEVAGFKFATLGVLYAVLLAFVVIIAWERFHDAEEALAALIFSAILVVIAIDRPFTGAVVVSKQPIRAVLDDMQILP
jgi:hypothetical protein